jgi:hypothetical protein
LKPSNEKAESAESAGGSLCIPRRSNLLSVMLELFPRLREVFATRWALNNKSG